MTVEAGGENRQLAADIRLSPWAEWLPLHRPFTEPKTMALMEQLGEGQRISMWSNWILYQQLTAIACLEASGNWAMENHCPTYSVGRTASAIFVTRHPFGFITNSPRQRLLVLPIQPIRYRSRAAIVGSSTIARKILTHEYLSSLQHPKSTSSLKVSQCLEPHQISLHTRHRI